MTPATGDGTPRARWSAFARLGAGMGLLGLVVGTCSPLVAERAGLLPAGTATPRLVAASLGTGLALGAANWLLTRQVIGSRLRLLAGRITEVAQIVGDPVASAQVPTLPPAELALPVGSPDDLGTTAVAFNSLLTALDRERRFRSVVHASHDVMALLTPDGQVSFVSDSVTEVLGWTREQLLGRHAGELLYAEDDHLFTPAGAPITHDDE